MFDGASKCIEITKDRQEKIMSELKAMLQIRSSVPFNRFGKKCGRAAAGGDRGAIREVSLWLNQQIDWDAAGERLLGPSASGGTGHVGLTVAHTRMC